MDTVRFGRSMRALRRRSGLRQADVAARAGVSDSTVSRVERGVVGSVPFARLRRIGEVVGAEVELHVRWHGEGLDRLLDETHAQLVDAVVALLRRLGWEVVVEATFAIDGERGAVDVLAWHASTGNVLVVEVKSVVPDAQAMISTLDRKTRLARAIAAERGWAAVAVSRVLVVAESRTARARVERFRAMFEAAFPLRGRTALAWVRQPTGAPVSALVFLDPAVRARRDESSDSRRVPTMQRVRVAKRAGAND